MWHIPCSRMKSSNVNRVKEQRPVIPPVREPLLSYGLSCTEQISESIAQRTRRGTVSCPQCRSCVLYCTPVNIIAGDGQPLLAESNTTPFFVRQAKVPSLLQSIRH
jgi:hypothetical protein